jgi:glycosyltransferase involved in cell wall biosynthesis
MPVRDLAPYVAASVESILSQTYGDFEFVIRDDGSTDGTRDILRRLAAGDGRIRLFESDASLGPAASSNWVVERAEGEIVARMDGDDIAHPERLERQLAALDADPEACLAGTLWEGIDEQGRLVRPRDRWRLANPTSFAPFPHGSIMFRREAFERAGGYRGEADYWEDLDLYRRLSAVGRLIVLPAALYRHRSSVLSTRIASPAETVEAAVDRMYRQVRGDRPGTASDGKILPQVYLSLGSTRLWAGHSPAVLARLLRNGALQWNLETGGILVWAAWGALSPRSLRFVLKLMVAVRDRAAGRRFPDDAIYHWSCPTAGAPVPPLRLAAEAAETRGLTAPPAPSPGLRRRA